MSKVDDTKIEIPNHVQMFTVELTAKSSDFNNRAAPLSARDRVLVQANNEGGRRDEAAGRGGEISLHVLRLWRRDILPEFLLEHKKCIAVHGETPAARRNRTRQALRAGVVIIAVAAGRVADGGTGS